MITLKGEGTSDLGPNTALQASLSQAMFPSQPKTTYTFSWICFVPSCRVFALLGCVFIQWLHVATSLRTFGMLQVEKFSSLWAESSLEGQHKLYARSNYLSRQMLSALTASSSLGSQTEIFHTICYWILLTNGIKDWTWALLCANHVLCCHPCPLAALEMELWYM